MVEIKSNQQCATFAYKAVLSDLPSDAHILCVGAGTGAEILQLAQEFPDWRFTAVEPSIPMLEVFRRKAQDQGIISRCVLHAGYLDSHPQSEKFDAATAFLVSQFIVERKRRTEFFRGIAHRLRPGGILVSSDLTGNLNTSEGQVLLETWFKVMSGIGIPPEGVERMRKAYTSDVAVLPTTDVQRIILQGGFESPVQYFQAGMIHAWCSKRSVDVN